MKEITNILLKAGWKKCGRVEAYKKLNTKHGDVIIDFPPRKRFCHGISDRCTVGKLTTCFYSISKGVASDFQKCKTSDIKAVEEVIRQLAERNLQPVKREEKYSND